MSRGKDRCGWIRLLVGWVSMLLTKCMIRFRAMPGFIGLFAVYFIVIIVFIIVVVIIIVFIIVIIIIILRATAVASGVLALLPRMALGMIRMGATIIKV